MKEYIVKIIAILWIALVTAGMTVLCKGIVPAQVLIMVGGIMAMFVATFKDVID